MIGYSVLLSSLVIGLILCNLILCRKIPLFTLSLSVLYWLSYLIKVVDPLYYNNLIGLILSSDEIEEFLFDYSFLSFVISLFEFLLLLLISLRKKNNRLDKAMKNATLDSEVFEEIRKNGEFILIDYNNLFYLNKISKSYLEVDNNVISEEEFMSLINSDDFDAYKKNNYFRLKTINNYEWFERKIEYYQEKKFNVITRIKADNYSNITVGDFSSLEQKLEGLKNTNSSYGILLIHIMNLYLDKGSYYMEENDDTLRTVITSKYIVSLKDFFENNLINVYKLGSNEFAFIIEKKNTLNFLINKIKINDTVLNDFIYFIDEKKYLVKSKVAVILSNNDNEDIVNRIAESLEAVLLSDKFAYISELDSNPSSEEKSNEKKKETKLSIKEIDIDINKDII